MKNSSLFITCLLTFCAVLFLSDLSAQSRYEYRVKAGFNLGGTLPMPLPVEIRKITGYSPTLSLSLEGNIVRKFTKRWGVLTGLRFEIKGMNAKARVKGYQLSMNINSGDEQGEVSGMFTGNVNTNVKNEYLTIPLMATLQLSPRWEFRFGPYFSYLIGGEFLGSANNGYIRDGSPTGTKIGVESASFDFSKDIRHFNWGADVGAEWRAYKHLSVYADLTVSANSIFKKGFTGVSFDMYNLYLNIGFGYVF